jgi:hypothetical protein
MNVEQQKGTSHLGDGGEGGTPTSSPGLQQNVRGMGLATSLDGQFDGAGMRP